MKEKELKLRESREGLKIKATELLDKAIEEKRDLNDTENEELRSLENQIKNLDKAIDLLPKNEQREIPQFEDGAEEREQLNAEEEVREFVSFLKGERRALVTNSGANTPVSVENTIRTLVGQLSPIRANSNVIPLTGSSKILVGSADISASYVSEGSTITPDTSTVSPVTFDGHKLTGIVKVSEEFLNDSPAGSVNDYLNRAVAKAFAKVENLKFVLGSGSGEPQGCITGASTGVTCASTSAITASELRSWLLSIDQSLMPNAIGLVNASTMGALMALADDNDFIRIFWDASTNTFRVNGIPFYINSNIASIAASAKVGVIGDFKNYYAIGDRQGMDVQRLNELYRANGYVGFKFTARNDAHVLDDDAFKLLVMAAE